MIHHVILSLLSLCLLAVAACGEDRPPYMDAAPGPDRGASPPADLASQPDRPKIPRPDRGLPPKPDGWKPPKPDSWKPPKPDGWKPPKPDGGKPGPCPKLMVLVNKAFCIDRFEAALQQQQGGAWVKASPYLTVGTRKVRAIPAKGMVPQGYISGLEAAQACANAGKRLCTSTEWLAACQGPGSLTYPYGKNHQPGACNDDYQGHPVVKYFGTSTGIWDAKHMNDPGINKQPGTVAKGGDHPKCVSAHGVADMHGNLHEWVADAAGTFRGGFYADAKINGAGCLYKTTAHGSSYHDYSTGFRCCAKPL